MSDRLDLLFHGLTLLVLPLWLLMIAAPKWDVSVRVVRSTWCIVPIALAYAAIVVPQLPSLLPMLLDPDLRQQLAYVGAPEGYLAIYSHALALDLFVGRWAYLDGYRSGRSPWIMSPILFVILLLGPLGLLLYLGVRGLDPMPPRRPPIK